MSSFKMVLSAVENRDVRSSRVGKFFDFEACFTDDSLMHGIKRQRIVCGERSTAEHRTSSSMDSFAKLNGYGRRTAFRERAKVVDASCCVMSLPELPPNAPDAVDGLSLSPFEDIRSGCRAGSTGGTAVGCRANEGWTRMGGGREDTDRLDVFNFKCNNPAC